MEFLQAAAADSAEAFNWLSAIPIVLTAAGTLLVSFLSARWSERARSRSDDAGFIRLTSREDRIRWQDETRRLSAEFCNQVAGQVSIASTRLIISQRPDTEEREARLVATGNDALERMRELRQTFFSIVLIAPSGVVQAIMLLSDGAHKINRFPLTQNEFDQIKDEIADAQAELVSVVRSHLAVDRTV